MDEVDENPGKVAPPCPDALMETDQPHDDQSTPSWIWPGEKFQASSIAEGKNTTGEQSCTRAWRQLQHPIFYPGLTSS